MYAISQMATGAPAWQSGAKQRLRASMAVSALLLAAILSLVRLPPAQSLAPLEVVVHNAGSNMPAPFLKVSQERFERHWREHTLGGFQTAQAAIPILLQHGGGTLVFTGASGSLRGKANFAPFAAAKAGLRALAQSLAREFGPQNIHVGHVVIDGGIAGDRLLELMPDLLEQRGPDGMLDTEAIAEAYWMLHSQHRSAWSHEIDLRPWAETF